MRYVVKRVPNLTHHRLQKSHVSCYCSSHALLSADYIPLSSSSLLLLSNPQLLLLSTKATTFLPHTPKAATWHHFWQPEKSELFHSQLTFQVILPYFLFVCVWNFIFRNIRRKECLVARRRNLVWKWDKNLRWKRRRCFVTMDPTGPFPREFCKKGKFCLGSCQFLPLLKSFFTLLLFSSKILK